MFPKPILFRRGPLCPYCLSSNLIQPAIFHRCYNQSLPYTIAFSLSYLAHKHINKSYQLVDAFVFPSKFTQNFYTEYAHLSPQKTIHIPNFTFPPTQKSPENRDYFTYLGRLFPEKGIELLLKAIISLTHLKFLIVGQGPLENLVKSVANHHPHITYHPFVSPAKIHTIYSQSLFTILPSTWYEVQPMAIIESFAYHTPVIAPALGPLPQMIVPSKNGFLYHPNTPEKLRQAILSAASLSKQKYDLFSQNSHHTYQTNYTPSIHYRSLISLYLKLVGTGSSPSPKYIS